MNDYDMVDDNVEHFIDRTILVVVLEIVVPITVAVPVMLDII